MKPSPSDKQLTTVADLVERLKELPQTANVISFELVGKDKFGYTFETESK